MQYWLKVNFQANDSHTVWPLDFEKIEVALTSSITIPIERLGDNFRVSPIFPLLDKGKSLPNFYKIRFIQSIDAYKILGRIQELGTSELKESTWFSIGLASIIIVHNNIELIKEFSQINTHKIRGIEDWDVKDGKLTREPIFFFESKDQISFDNFEIPEYSELALDEIPIIDEFVANISLMASKVNTYIPEELDILNTIVDEIHELVEELVYLNTFSGTKPDTLSEFSVDDLKSAKLNSQIKHQNIDRIHQVNSALIYVSTQAFSGAIPILERRSLIRRHSLLGVGSAILALNNFARFVEEAFSKISIESNIADKMQYPGGGLPGISKPYKYISTNWRTRSINTFTNGELRHPHPKLPYFSARLGFRETEYTISAAIQSLSSGVGLNWSLFTVSHEMMHGHVRMLLTTIFQGDVNQKSDKKRKEFYDHFFQRVVEKSSGNEEKLIESIRLLIFTYCCLVETHGSLTIDVPPNKKGVYNFNALPKNKLWRRFESEYRNISEIMVHILDLHYFYNSKIEDYIPLIWSSWSSIPHIYGDKRQYILRSILTITAGNEGNPLDRFWNSINELETILTDEFSESIKSFPIVKEIIDYIITPKEVESDSNSDYSKEKLKYNKKRLEKSLFPSFKASLIIVDLVNEVLLSNKIRGELYKDPLFKVSTELLDDEKDYYYDIENGFNDISISSPVAFLFDKMRDQLLDKSISFEDNILKETATAFLALNSK